MDYTPPPLAGARILGGVLTHGPINFRFEVWAFRKLTKEEIAREFSHWFSVVNESRPLRHGVVVQHVSHIGCEPR